MSETISGWLHDATSKLTAAGVSTARLDCLVLLEDATGKDRGWLLAHPDFELPPALTTILDARVYRRAQHVPLAYIRGKVEFYGREFIVNAHTLVPRPETETMIDLLKGFLPCHPELDSEPALSSTGGSMRSNPTSAKDGAWIPDQVRSDTGLTLVDIGTGSGAIAITAKLELPEAEIIATDIDEKCLEAARTNALKLGADITFLQGNLLEPLTKSGHSMFGISILLCNLPYVPDNFQINTAATHEPRHALFGGGDGLDLYRELFRQVKAGPFLPNYILTESLPPQHETLANIAKGASYDLLETSDFIQVFQYS